jgi:HAE1 family hydrophobic/amphiphilic exporter-1
MSLLTRLSLANRAIVALLCLLILGAGLWAAASSKQELIPPITEPQATVSVSKAGSSPATLDQQVVAPLSDALSSIAEIQTVTSSTSAGGGQVSVTWAFGADSEKIIAEIKSVTAGVISAGPSGVTSQVIAGSIDDVPVLSLALTSEDSLDALAERIETSLVPVLENLPGVRSAEITGRIQERVVVTLQPAALVERSIEQETVASLLRTEGAIVAAGTSVEGSRSFAIEVGQENSSLDQLRAIQIPTLAGPVPLSQVATVELVPIEQTSLSRSDGRPSIGLTVVKNPDANTVQVSSAALEAVNSSLAGLAAGADSEVVFNQATLIEQSVKDLAVEGGLGLLFAVLVILVFLVSARATIVTAISIPLSILIAVIGLNVSGYALNILTLAALTVAVGRVVDDSIVVIENISRRRGPEGLTPESIRESVGQVAGAVTASTLTTVAVFLPVGFIGGVAGELFRPFAVTVAIALVASLLVSLTIVPVLAYWLLRKPASPRALNRFRALFPMAAAGKGDALVEPQAHSDRVTGLQRLYLPALGFALRRPVVMVMIAVLALGGTVVGAASLKTDLLGSFGDERTIRVEQELPLGTTLAAADATAVKLEAALAKVTGIEHYQTTIGTQGAPISVVLGLSKEADPIASIAAVQSAVAALPGANDITVASDTTAASSTTVDVIVTGTNESELSAASQQIQGALERLSTVGKVTTNLAADQPVLRVEVDASAAANAGYSVSEIGAAVAGAVDGQNLGTVTIDDRTRELVIRSVATANSPDAIRSLSLPVSAIQQQRAQRDATAALTLEQERISAKASREALEASDSQLRELQTARQGSANSIAALSGDLSALLANPPSADPTPITAGELALANWQNQVDAVTGGISGAEASVVQLDQQIAQLRASIADSLAQQAESARLAQAQRDIEKLRAQPIQLGDVATVTVENTPATITRIDGERAVTISVEPAGGNLGATTSDIEGTIATLTLPSSVSLSQTGAGADQAASFQQLGLAMLVAIALVYIVLVGTFRSLVQPILLLVAVPLAATGAVAALLVTGTSLGIPALIGMLMLIGIVVTNAIVLIDLINENRRHGAGIDDAVTHGARLRLRPIIMTAAATIFALLPMAVGLTGGSAFISQSLAIVVIGGLVSSTVLTLLILPALYALRERSVERAAARRARRRESLDLGDVSVTRVDARERLSS